MASDLSPNIGSPVRRIIFENLRKDFDWMNFFRENLWFRTNQMQSE